MPVALLCAALVLSYFGVPGTFRGTVVRGPDHQRGWIYVAGHNDTLRKVEVTQAVVTYDDSVPAHLRKRAASDSLVEGAEIRVTAEPDKSGGWHATEIEILQVAPKRQRATTSAGVSSTPI